MIPPVVFFSIIFSLNNKATAYCGGQQSQCPRDSRTNKEFDCSTAGLNEVVKDYENIFPGVNTLQLSGSYRCTDPEGCDYCHCNEGSVQAGYSGLTGRNCETKFELCPDGRQVCFHGAHCLQVADNNEYICACAYLNGPDTYMGEHCEYKANDVCEVQALGSLYCTNNGICNNSECQCKEGFYGLHCEFLDEPECDMDCKNGGSCTRGVEYTYSGDDDKNLSRFVDDDHYLRESEGVTRYHEDDEDDFYTIKSASYCICPKGWSGETCQYDENENENECGDAICMNGSNCQVDPSTEEGDFYCDCSNTRNDDGDKAPHAGLYCERIYTSMCVGQDGYTDSEFYCTNGGLCPSDIHLPCNCSDGFSGPRCEFKGTATKECSLPCENDGTCFFGDRPDDISGDYGKSEMHCKCPKGYTGFLCELPVDICDAGEHHCLNNGKCVKDGEDYKCDCTTAITHVIHAGEHCEHEATSFCQGSAANINSFCTNRGICKDTIDTSTNSVHPGCDCESPFFGDHCEKGATLAQTMELYCEGPGGFACYNHGTCKELPATSSVRAHPGCVCEPPYFGDLCQYKATSHRDGTAWKAFLGFTISVFGLLAIFFLIVFFRRNKDSSRNVDHTPIGVPPEVHVHALDLDNANDNTEIMGTGYDDEDDDEKEVMENVYIS